MLAAASDLNNSLATLQVALSTIGVPSTGALSDGLKEHVVRVLREASVIVRNPASVNANTLPEAIGLAVKLLHEQALRDDLEYIDNFGAISPEVAARLLRVCTPRAFA